MSTVLLKNIGTLVSGRLEDPLLDADEVRRVSALHCDLDLLDVATQLCPPRLLRAEEEPAEPRREGDAPERDPDLR